MFLICSSQKGSFFMKGNKKGILYLTAFILLMVSGMVYKYVIRNRNSGFAITTASSEISLTSSSSLITDTSGSSSKISIYICGEVQNPGVYEVDCGTMLNEVALKAGGFTESAAIEHLNLVYEFNSNISVYIPNEDTLSQGDDIIMRRGSMETSVQSSLININSIGDSTAQAIITYRTDRRFDRIEDIMNVAGIGEAKFARIRDLITV